MQLYTLVVLACSAYFSLADAASFNLAGILLRTNVAEEARLDLDMVDINTYLDSNPVNLAGVDEVYRNGKNSFLEPNVLRSFKSLAPKANQFPNDPNVQAYLAYFNGDLDFALNQYLGVWSRTGVYQHLSTTAQKEFIRGIVLYQHVFFAVVQSLAQAHTDCLGRVSFLGDAKSTLDAAWAYWAGSKEEAMGVLGNGVMLYDFAERMCTHFDTCITAPNLPKSAVNAHLRSIFASLVEARDLYSCAAFGSLAPDFLNQARVPMLQGLMLYAYRMDPASGYTNLREERIKSNINGYTLMIGLAPYLSATCDPILTSQLLANYDFQAAAPMKDGYVAVIQMLQSLLSCLKLDCAEVGNLNVPNAPKCENQEWASKKDWYLANYRMRYDVMNYAKIDRDMVRFEAAVLAREYDLALDVYSTKGFGEKSLRSLSSDAATAQKGEPAAELVRAYWGSYTIGDELVMKALKAEDEFAAHSDSVAVRPIFAAAGVQFFNLWGFVVHQLAQSVSICRTGSSAAAVMAVDQAWAVYSGSLKQANGLGAGPGLFAAAQRECGRFGTCLGGDSTRAKVNFNLLSQFSGAQASASSLDCDTLNSTVYTRIVPQLYVPIIQSVIHLADEADEKATPVSERRVEARVELWALTMAILPFVHACNPKSAATLRKNADFFSGSPMSDGVRVYVRALQDTYHCLNLKCADVGGNGDRVMVNGQNDCNYQYSIAAGEYGIQCTSYLTPGGKAGIAFAVLFGLILLMLICFCVFRRRKANIETGGGAPFSAPTQSFNGSTPSPSRLPPPPPIPAKHAETGGAGGRYATGYDEEDVTVV